jgi:hypothetical protein
MTPILFLFIACTATKEEDPLEHACEHYAEGAGTAISAGATPEEAASVSIGEEAYTVSLVESTPGYVGVTVTGDTAAILFVNTADVAANLWNGSEEVGLPEAAPNDACPTDIPEHYDLDLHTAGTWYIELGPAAVAEVWLMVAPAGDHVDEG